MLQAYNSSNFNSASAVDLDDTFVGDGVTTTFFLQNKPASRLGATITSGNIQFLLSNGGFTVNLVNNSFTLATAPPLGAQILAPGITPITASAYDQPVIPGVPNPNVDQRAIYVSDTTQIFQNQYLPLPTLPGIQLSIVNLVSSFPGVQSSWCQFASSDINGNALTFQATGTPYYGPSIFAQGTMLASSAPGATSIQVLGASSFNAGGYSVINFGNLTAEYINVTQILGNTMYLGSGTNYTHSVGENVFDDGWKAWVRVTVPINVANNTAVNLFNCAINIQASIAARG